MPQPFRTDGTDRICEICVLKSVKSVVSFTYLLYLFLQYVNELFLNLPFRFPERGCKGNYLFYFCKIIFTRYHKYTDCEYENFSNEAEFGR